MAWITPKTDWYGTRNQDGIYEGDRFNASDWNRMVGNLTELRTMWGGTPTWGAMPSTKAVGDFLDSDQIDRLFEWLYHLNLEVLGSGTRLPYDRFFDWQTLNAVETQMQTLYDTLGGST
jgi:hypothetical protein